VRNYTSSSYGNVVVIDHKDPVTGESVLQTVYAHMATVGSVGIGQPVTKGQQIGVEGSTGRSSGPHLHYEMRGPTFAAGGPQAGAGLDQTAEVYDPLKLTNGDYIMDDGTGQSLADGEIVENAVAQNRILPIDSKPSTGCSTPVTDRSVPSSADPTAGVTGDNSGCPQGLTKEDVIAEINATLDQHPELDAADRQYILFVAKIESSYNPCAANPYSSAKGLYQFLDGLAAVYYPPGTSQGESVAADTEAMISFYKKEQLPYYNEYQSTGKMARQSIAKNAHTATYSSLSKTQFCYGLIHHDGVGNAVRGVDKGGVAYVTKRLNEYA